jgi:hypothetical protein
MNKWLLCLLQQAVEKIRPKTSAWLIRTINKKVAGARNQRELEKIIQSFSWSIICNLRRKKQTPEETIAQFKEAVSILRDVWAFTFAQWLESCYRSIVLLLNWLKSPLCNNQVRERITLVVEEVRRHLIEKYWPPTRQRCDHITAPAIN